MAGTAVIFLSVTLAHVILHLRVARTYWIPKRDGYIHTRTVATALKVMRPCVDNH